MKRGLPVAWLLASLLLLVLLLPIAAPFFVRFDENRLIRQTEETLLVEAATVGEIYRALALPAWRNERLPELTKERYQPFALSLDLRTTPILPRAERDIRPARTFMASTSSIAAILDGVLERAQVRTLSDSHLDLHAAIARIDGRLDALTADLRSLLDRLPTRS